MPLVFSPLTEAVLDSTPKSLRARHAFIMRQMGGPPAIDLRMLELVREVFEARRFPVVDAGISTGGKDYLERILGLIRSTGFTFAIYSDKTRLTAVANIMLELGFAAMCGKPIIIVKSEKAKAPSDLSRTDWIVYSPDQEADFTRKLQQALDNIEELVHHEHTLVGVALEARSMDCAIAFERVNKGYLLSGERRFVKAARAILKRLDSAEEKSTVGDLDRLRSEIRAFLKQT